MGAEDVYKRQVLVMAESSVNVTLGVGEVIKEVKDTKTIEEVDKTSALVVRAIHAALSLSLIHILFHKGTL